MLVNAAEARFVGVPVGTSTSTLLSLASAMLTGRLLVSSVTVYLPGIRSLRTTVLLSPFLISISTFLE